MDAETLAMLRASLEQVLVDRGPLGIRLEELGWADVVADDRATALRALFEVKGSTLSAADALDLVLGDELAEALGADELRGAVVVLPVTLHPDRPSSNVAAGRIDVHGVVMREPVAGEILVVPVTGGGDDRRLAAVPVDVTALSFRPVRGFDPDLGLISVEGAVALDAVQWLGADEVWMRAVATGRWAVGAELVGVAQHMVATVVPYARDRHQFGRPIGSFQAVQHRLADAHAAVVGASGVVAEASSSGSAWAALVGKALAGQACEEAARQVQQVYGAIGFTWEHGFHRWLRRCYVLDALLGDWRTLVVEVGTRLRDDRQVPRVGVL